MLLSKISPAMSEGLLTGFSVGGIDISCILFVDDTLIFSRADPNHPCHLWCLLLCFATLRLKINLAKSELVPMGNVGNVERLASILECGVFLPLKYFGLPLRASYKMKSIWYSIIEKIERQCICLKAVELPLLRAHFPTCPSTSCPFFLFIQVPLFPLHASVANCIEKI
jgi:hypothetical protein